MTRMACPDCGATMRGLTCTNCGYKMPPSRAQRLGKGGGSTKTKKTPRKGGY